MAIIGGLDVHRSQITYDWTDTDTGQRQRGQLDPATASTCAAGWSSSPAGSRVRTGGLTGWRYVVEELGRAGIAARRAKTDQLDARDLRELLAAGRLPESWIPPAHVLEVRIQVRSWGT